MPAIWRKLLGNTQAPPEDRDARQRIAMAVLLLECARADFDRSETEMTVVREALAGYFGIDHAALASLLDEASEEARRAVSLHDYVAQLNAGLQPGDKLELIAMLWRVAYADGHLDPQEEALLRRLADLLYVPHRDYIAAKLAAESAAGAS